MSASFPKYWRMLRKLGVHACGKLYHARLLGNARPEARARLTRKNAPETQTAGYSSALVRQRQLLPHRLRGKLLQFAEERTLPCPQLHRPKRGQSCHLEIRRDPL